jgi:hypothetical protein
MFKDGTVKNIEKGSDFEVKVNKYLETLKPKEEF